MRRAISIMTMLAVVACAHVWAQDAKPWEKPGTTAGQEIVGPDGGKMVWVPAGEFLMGSADGGANANEQPQRTVYLDGYWMHRSEVTKAQYRKFIEQTGRHQTTWGLGGDQPMYYVTWEDASAYAQWVGLALPTEAQWEKAARGTDGRLYPWGSTWDPLRCANSVGQKLGGPESVGAFPAGASPYGCLDMAGNLAEWCADWYQSDYYQSASNRNPLGPEQDHATAMALIEMDGTFTRGPVHVVRGGSWNRSTEADFRCNSRGTYGIPVLSNWFTGFRCVSTPK